MNDVLSGEDALFLFDLAGRLFHNVTPAMGFDQGDTDTLYRIARNLGDPLIATNQLHLSGLITDAEFDRIKNALRAREGK